MNAAMIQTLIDGALALVDIVSRLQIGLAALKQAQAEGRPVTQAEIDAAKTAYQKASTDLSDAINRHGG